jgi:hypothetical protein
MKRNVTEAENRTFGLMTSGGLVLVFICRLVFHKMNGWPFLLFFAALLLLLTIVRPSLLNTVRSAWIRLGEVLGMVNTYLILSVIFLCIITPLGLLLRIFGKKRLSLGWKKQQLSYWVNGDAFNVGSFDKQF